MSTSPAPVELVPFRIRRTKAIGPRDDVLVYIAYCPDGKLSALQRLCIASYHAEGYRIVLVVNSGADDHDLDPGPSPAVIEIIRENIGFDFGGWGHAARLIADLGVARTVSFANDSVVGPLPGDGNSGLRATVDEVDGEAVFMTESVQIRPHGQSYFFAFKKGAIDKGALQFMAASRYFGSTRRVVINEELTLADRLREHGISVGVAFPCEEAIRHAINPVFFFWDYLVSTGFPFVKASLVPDGRIAIDAPELAAVIGPQFHAALRSHLSQRPAHAPVQFDAVQPGGDR